ncbi:hypothetical protein Tco_0612015, partial [Tanacetum coccineum]
ELLYYEVTPPDIFPLRHIFGGVTEVGEVDSSKQGRKFSNEGVQDDEGVHEKASTETKLFVRNKSSCDLILPTVLKELVLSA